jgi:hypothetical protein
MKRNSFCANGAKPACAASAFQIEAFNLKVVSLCSVKHFCAPVRRSFSWRVKPGEWVYRDQGFEETSMHMIEQNKNFV